MKQNAMHFTRNSLRSNQMTWGSTQTSNIRQQSSHLYLGCNTGTGNSVVSQPRVAQVRVRCRNLGPEAVPQPVTAVSWVFAVLSVHCQSRSVIVTIIIILTSFLFTNIGVPEFVS